MMAGEPEPTEELNIDPARAGFVWPPRTPDAGAMPDQKPRPTLQATHRTVDGLDETKRPDPEAGMTPETNRAYTPDSFWRAFERTVLGASGAAMPRDWTPEPVVDACMRCAGTVGLGETDTGGCAACRTSRLAWAHAVRLGPYSGVLRNGVIACKYRSDRGVGRQLGKALGERVADRFRALGLDGARVLVVPVPTTRRRRFGNGGVDHALVLARGVARQLDETPARLLRRKHGPRQAASSAAERARNVSGAFSMRSGLAPPACDAVVLVDDVRTTGATATACFREIVGAYAGRSVRGVGAPSRKPGRNGSGQSEPLPVLILATVGVSESRRSKTALTEREGG